jgi:hypothetical protein
MPKGTAAANSLLNLLYRAVAWANVADNAAASPLTNLYLRVARSSYAPTDTADANEANFTNYAGGRPIPRTTGGWTAPSGGTIATADDVEFPQCGASGNSIVAGCTSPAATGATPIWHYGDLNAPVAISNQIVLRFAAGSVGITEA